MGRMRNANVDYAPVMMWATNPMYDHGIYHWIKDFYLGDDGIPLIEKSNIERYFVLQNNKPLWYDTREAAEAIHGKSSDNGVQSFRAIRSHVTENIPLMKANPGYLTNLMSLPTIKRRIFLDGSWTAREEEAGLFKREFVRIVDLPNMRAKRRVFAFDMASSPVDFAALSSDA